MIDIGRINYRHMNKYLESLLNLTCNVVQKAMKDEDATDMVALFAIEVWNAMAEEDLKLRER